MKIEHIAIWTNKLEEMKKFYEQFFDGKSNEKYLNPKKNFESYFIKFKDGARLELMKINPMTEKTSQQPLSGYCHVAYSVGSKEKVDELTNKLRNLGYKITSEPRKTGDGYYESCVLDPDGNTVEITI